MLPFQKRALLVSTGRLVQRTAYSIRPKSDKADPPVSSEAPSSNAGGLTGAAKLLADAAEEEALKDSSRDHLVYSQGPIWTGEESTHDAVLRMLVDAHKPHRTGEGIQPNSADKRIQAWMNNLDMSPRPIVTSKNSPPLEGNASSENVGNALLHPHRTNIPPHLHRPWHSTYTGENEAAAATPQIKYGNITSKPIDRDNLFSDLELRLKPDADGTQRKKVRETKTSALLQGRIGGAREGAIDYRLGISDGDLTNVGSSSENTDHDDQTFRGNRQVRGMSVLGGRRGAGSGMRAWGGLVEERIQNARDTGFFHNLPGRGAPIVADEAEKNPNLELSEVFMNRIIKRHGALPPWIEMQNQLDKNVDSFRNLLLDSYSRHLIRAVISTNTINPLPPFHSIPGHDEAWEAREHKFHQESIRQINDLTRKMNTQAPFMARRGVLNLELELNKVRGDVLRNKVWEGVKQRRQEILDLEARGPPQRRSFLSGSLDGKSGSGIFGRLGKVLDRPRDSDGSGGGGYLPSGGVMSTNGSNPHHAGGGMGLLIFAGLGVGAILVFRRPAQADSPEDWTPLIPLVEPTEPEHADFVASSPAEPSYSPIEFVRQYILEPILTIVRFLHLALLFGPVILTAPMLMVGSQRRRRLGKPVADPEENWGAVWWYGFLVNQMERAGPSFIKLAQWAASRADLFPASLCAMMSKLHSSNDPHPFRYTKRAIEKSFGHTFDEIFEEFDEKPIGCGAIAQVYKAKLRPEILVGSEAELQVLREELKNKTDDDQQVVTSVAVKVLHPRVDKLVRRDIAIMSIFAKIINAFPGMQWISLPEEVLVFGDMMNQQLDLRVEASNLDRFEANFRYRGKIIAFPKAIRVNGQLAASRKVLIEEYEDALPLKYFLRNGGGPYDEQIANFGLDAFLEMLLLDNFTHGDLHPGNIMVRFIKPETHHVIGPLLHKLQGHATPAPLPIPMESKSAVHLVHELKAISGDKTKWLDRLDQLEEEGYVPQLIFIDAGLVTSLNEKNRRDFLDLFQAIAEFDGYRAGKLMVERCRHPELAIDEETFALKIQHLVLNVKSKTFSLAKIKISDILADVLTAVRQHHVKLEGDFVNTVISVLLLEGIGRQLDPNMDLFKSALPILRQVGRQMSTRDALQHANTKNIWAMAKLWIWAEARSVVGATSAIDQWIKYDLLFPNI